MENFLETNSNENSFLFLTLSNKYFKKSPAMENCKNSLDCFEYYANVASNFSTQYKVVSSIEKFPNTESYHLHILIDITDTSNAFPGGITYDLLSYAENHLEKHQYAEWKESTDKYGNPTITYSPAFKLKIVNTIDNKNEVIKYILKYKDQTDKIKDALINMLITRYCNMGKSGYPKNRQQFMGVKEYQHPRWIKYRDTWRIMTFSSIYINSINLENYPTGS